MTATAGSGLKDAATGSSAYCIKQTNQGFDFLKEFTYQSKTYTFEKSEVTSVEPNGSSSLKAREKNLNGSCGDAYGNRFIEESHIVWACQDYEEQRTDGSVDRLDLNLRYKYNFVPE